MSAPARSSSRVRKATDLLTYPANNGGGGVAASKKKQKQQQALASASPSTDTNSSVYDNVAVIGGTVIYTFVKKKNDIHETTLVADDEDQVKDDAGAGGEVLYTLNRQYRKGSSAEQQSRMFAKPSDENRVAVPTDDDGERFHWLDNCQKVDGKNCEVRTKGGFADLPKEVQVRIGRFGQAKQYIVSGERVPGSNIYEAIHLAPVRQGGRNRSKKDSRDPDCSLLEFVGGKHDDLVIKDGQTTIYHRKDMDGNDMFKIELFNWRNQDRDEIKKIVEQNTHIRDACLARKDEVDKMRHEHGIMVTSQTRGHMYEIKELDDDGRVKGRVKSAKSLATVRKITGDKLNQVIVVNQGILPAEMNQEVEIKTSRGTFRVKRVSEARFKEIASKK